MDMKDIKFDYNFSLKKLEIIDKPFILDPGKITDDIRIKIGEADEDDNVSVAFDGRPQVKPFGPRTMEQRWYHPKDEEDLKKKQEAREAFEKYKEEKMAEWLEANPDPKAGQGYLRTMEYNSVYENWKMALMEFEHQLEVDFWNENPDYIPGDVIIVGDNSGLEKVEFSNIKLK